MRQKRWVGRGRRWRLSLAALGLLSTSGRPSPGTELPVPPTVVAVAIDASGSLSDADIARSRDLAVGLLGALPHGSEVAVFSFDDQSRLVQSRTSSVDLVRRAVSGVKRAGRFTALHDALYDASRYLYAAPGARRAIVLLTDGNDENSSLTLEDGLRVAQNAGIPVFAVGMGQVQERVLRRIAKLTGGEYLTGPGISGAALAERVEGLPAAAASTAAERRAPPAAAAGPRTTAAGPRSSAEGTGQRATGARARTVLWVWVLLMLGAAAAVAVLALRGRRASRCGTCGRALPDALSACAFCGNETGHAAGDATLQTDLSPTVLERLNATEEYLEKTITLRERPVLTITSGPGTGELFELSQATAISIGRARANDIVLEDVSISGQHCRIRPEDGGFVLHDLKSTNGTFVNDKRVSRHTLSDGDRVQVGETVMQFRNEHRRI